MKKIKCACLGGKKKDCEGECREKNLERKRTKLERCPAAYEVLTAYENPTKSKEIS